MNDTCEIQKPKRRHVRKPTACDSETRGRGPIDEETALRMIEIAKLEQAVITFRETIRLWNKLCNYLVRCSKILDWMTGTYENAPEPTKENPDPLPTPFVEVCQNIGCVPDEIHGKVVKHAPDAMMQIIMHGINYTCPFCGTKK